MRYWRHIENPELHVAVARYLSGARLDRLQIDLLRGYLVQWIAIPQWQNAGDLRVSAKLIRTRDDIDRWIARAASRDIDPL
jgi:hypothetical protein